MFKPRYCLGLVLTLALLLSLTTAAWAGKTYLKVPASDLVTLTYLDGNFYRVKGNGELSENSFKVSTRALIIMDIEWLFAGDANTTSTLKLYVNGKEYSNQVFATLGQINGNGLGGVNVDLDSGLVFSGSGTTVGVATDPDGVTTSLFLHGYLAP